MKIAPESSAARFVHPSYTIPQIGRALGVNALVVGDVLREGDHSSSGPRRYRPKSADLC